MTLAIPRLLASGIVWIAEGFIFSRFLDFSTWQVILMVIVYVFLWLLAGYALLRRLRTLPDEDAAAARRALSLAPMVALVIGSFASLPILVLIAVLGKLA